MSQEVGAKRGRIRHNGAEFQAIKMFSVESLPVDDGTAPVQVTLKTVSRRTDDHKGAARPIPETAQVISHITLFSKEVRWDAVCQCSKKHRRTAYTNQGRSGGDS